MGINDYGLIGNAERRLIPCLKQQPLSGDLKSVTDDSIEVEDYRMATGLDLEELSASRSVLRISESPMPSLGVTPGPALIIIDFNTRASTETLEAHDVAFDTIEEADDLHNSSSTKLLANTPESPWDALFSFTDNKSSQLLFMLNFREYVVPYQGRLSQSPSETLDWGRCTKRAITSPKVLLAEWQSSGPLDSECPEENLPMMQGENTMDVTGHIPGVFKPIQPRKRQLAIDQLQRPVSKGRMIPRKCI